MTNVPGVYTFLNNITAACYYPQSQSARRERHKPRPAGGGIDPTQAFTLSFNQLVDNANLSHAPCPCGQYSSVGIGYNLVLTFDNRTFDGSDFQFFDTRTDIGFTTASAPTTPEPAVFPHALTGLGLIAWMRRRRILR